MKERVQWRRVALYLLAIFSGFVAALGLVSLTGPVQLGNDAAAWVQAVGSVGAILGAIGIAAYERRVAKSAAEERDRLDNNARYTRAHRTMKRFKKVIAKQRSMERKMPAGDVIHPIEREVLPNTVLDLEHDCHLMKDAGSACLNAVRNFEDAQELIDHSMLRWLHGGDFFEKLRLAEDSCNQAINHCVKYLVTAKN